MTKVSSANTSPWELIAGVILVLVGAVAFIGCKKSSPDQAPVVEKAGPVAARDAAAGGPASHGKALFDNHCAQCHGERGDGQGLAARFLYPKPRDFREGKYRLITTSNRLPSDDDLMQVITRGMPGSAMIPFGHLAEADRRLLVAYVRQLTRTGIEDRVRQAAEKAGDEIEPSELARTVDRLAQVGEPLKLTTEIPAGADAISRGRMLYMSSCATCHGDTGKGDGAKEQRDDDGTPTQPRDFTRGIFKGGRDSLQLFARIAIGMPGTPMPGSPNLKPDEIAAMVAYIQSLSDPAAQGKVEHKRTTLVAQRHGRKLADSATAVDWSKLKAVPMVVSPLWWREYADPDLQVQAAHDGETLAVRLSWRDVTRNVDVLRTEDFEDMAALQLSRSQPEPFVGMGAVDRAIDLWLWRGRALSDAVAANPELDDYPFASPLYGQINKGQKLPDFVTARAAGNPNAADDRNGKASSLTAGGFGSTTFRPRTSQLVSSHATYADGRWSLVLRRPLAVKPDDGVSLKPGETCSIAFALWDGAARDRNGQKLISIWHDLRIAD
jgi:mono/diheme cytochrome c family protein